MPPGARRLFFCHIPKTAGGSIMELLRGAIPGERILAFEAAPQLIHVTDAELAQARLIAGHAGSGLIRRLPPDTHYMTVLRDPAARLRSLHRYLTQHEAIPAGMGLADFLEHPRFRAQTDNAQTWMICHDMDLAVRRMYEHREIDDEAILALAMESLRQFHLIGFQEAIPSFVDRLGRLTGQRFDSIGHKNRSTAANTPEPEDDVRTADALQRATALDRRLVQFARSIADRQWGITQARLSDESQKAATGSEPVLPPLRESPDPTPPGPGGTTTREGRAAHCS